MGRVHLFEWEDQAWFPHLWRNYMTDLLQFSFTWQAPRAAYVTRLLGRLLDAAGTDEIVDLCSGSSGPLLYFRTQLEAGRGRPVHVVLTDKFPNAKKFAELARNTGGRVSFRSDSVDATRVPEELAGARTMFLAFHHFRPEVARQILADAAAQRRAIGIFEGAERSAKAVVFAVLTIPLVVWLLTPFVRPFRWGRLLWTYALPVVPLAVWWDGWVSCLRTYSVAELEEMAASAGGKDYAWEAGRERVRGTPMSTTYLMGYPKKK
jgi:hypothetical protein